MKKSLIWAGIIGILGAWGVSLYNAALRLNFRPLLPQNLQIALGAFSFDMPLVVLNDSNRTLPVTGYAFDMYLNGLFLAKVYAFNVAFIPSGESVITGRVVIPISDLLAILPEIRTNSKSVSVRFAGNVRLLELLTIPVPDFVMSFTIPKISL